MPRIRIRLDDESLVKLERYASSRSLSVDRAASELLRLALQHSFTARKMNGLLVASLPADSPIVRDKQIKQLDSDER